MSPRCPPCVLWRWRERWLVVVVVFPFTFFRLSLVRVWKYGIPHQAALAAARRRSLRLLRRRTRRKGEGLPWTAPEGVAGEAVLVYLDLVPQRAGGTRRARPRGTERCKGAGRPPGVLPSVSLGLDSWAAGKRDYS